MVTNSVVKSYQFMGVAEMSSNLQPEKSFKYFWEPNKWFGSFELKWRFIKDIYHEKIRAHQGVSVSNNYATNYY